MNREELFIAGLGLTHSFCANNKIPMPTIVRLKKEDQLYHLATCAFYRPTTIRIMVEKCANKGFGGRAWSWPGYAIDRTPYGVLQHELGHHIDHLRFVPNQPDLKGLFSRTIYLQSGEPPLTGYLGTDSKTVTFFMEWFAENFRLFVTNPDLSRSLRPKFYTAMIAANFTPIPFGSWLDLLTLLKATPRIIEQAGKKIAAVKQEETLL